MKSPEKELPSMADEPRDLVLDHLRAIRAEIGAVREDRRETKARQASVEDMFSFLVSAITRVLHSLDRVADRVERIENRLGLTDEPATSQ
jgi:septal ring factor EnvC (AmiA/AmiB activator)